MTEAPQEQTGRIGRLRASAAQRYATAREEHPSVRHAVAGWQRLQRTNGNQYAAAITFFSFLALFPLVLLAVSVTGFVLSSHPALQQSLFDDVTNNVPGEFGTILKSSLHTAIDARTGVGIVGLFGVLLTGLGWIGNLRQAIDAVWDRTPPKQNFVANKLGSLAVLVGLGLALLASLALTAVGTSLTDQLLGWVGLDSVPGSTVILKILGIAIAVLGDMIIFSWLLVRLPQIEIPRRTAIKGVLLASVGFEVLKILGTYTVANTASSPTAGPFAGIVAVLVWIQLVARWMLYSCAVMAAMRDERAAPTGFEVAGLAAIEDRDDGDRPTSAITPATVGATLVGAGAVVGAVATVAATRAAHRARDDA